MAAVLLVGCGGGGDDGGDASPTTVAGTGTTAPPAVSSKPCELVTTAEVEAAVGAPVNAGGSVDTAEGTACSFALRSGGEGLILVVKSNTGYDTFRKAATDARDVTGVGDKAFVAANQAVVQNGSSVYVVLMTIDLPAPALTEAMTNLAKAAIG